MTKAQKNYTRIINTTRILKLPKRFEDLSYTDVEKDFIFYLLLIEIGRLLTIVSNL